jgi:hypothetical protein
MPLFPRRALLASLALPALQGCAAPFPPLPDNATTAEAQALLQASAAAQGAAAFAMLTDVSVSYAGQWRALVNTLQPDLVDSGFRGRSEERLLPRGRLLAQAYTGPKGSKHVVRRTAAHNEGEVRVWFNGQETHNAAPRDAAALVADGYALFLCGPMLLAGAWAADRSLVMQLASRQRITVDGQQHECDVLRVGLVAGLGLSQSDQLAVFIDRQEQLMRRVRFTLDGLDSTRGAVAEVDAWAHLTRHGVRWPTRFHERLLRPVPLPVHDWQMTGLDVNRGFAAADISTAEFTGGAAAAATPLPESQPRADG